MDGMPKHAIPAAPETRRRDHLWVLVIIAACALLEVWASWLGIGSVSGFPKLGSMTTGWILPVTTEAYWGYAVWAWLASSPGPRSRRFAMWTAIVMFTLSLGGQEAGHLVAAAHRQAPPYVVAFVTALPLIAVGLIAILIHLRQADREEAAEAARRAAEAAAEAALEREEADERASLRAALRDAHDAHEAEARALRDDLEAERSAREEAQREAAQRAGAEAERNNAVAALETEQAARQAAETARVDTERMAAQAEARAAQLARKLDRATGAQGTRNGGPSKRAGEARAKPETGVPDDVDARAEALSVLAEEPGISGAQLGLRVGMSKRWGQDFKKSLAETAPRGIDISGSVLEGDGET